LVNAGESAPDGEELFTRIWEPHDRRSANGDGLGPMFNQASCAGCHRQGGVGGGGPLDDNVVLREGSVVHRSSTIPGYGASQVPMAVPIPSTRPMKSLDPGLLSQLGVRGLGSLSRASSRNTPALFGVGLLDRVSDADIEASLCRTDPRFPEITGRLVRLEDGQIGRFGWKGDVPSLAAFVERACANELGLEVSAARQPAAPHDDRPASAPGLDLYDHEVDALTAYVGALPRPARHDDWRAAKGEALFDEVGCASCHTPRIGDLAEAYTDLLVHDMGPALDDRGASYGSPQLASVREGEHDDRAGSREWRTPPLWGVADSAPYLHDGRATTLSGAIRSHGGEASRTSHRFFRLSAEDQGAVVDFLRSLRAPEVPFVRS
jgi:CxxC motif-containing protein (DUF1111 family)